jgi:Flp pilus assembly protein TadB
MIGLWAAAALFGGAVFLGISGFYPSPSVATRRPHGKPLSGLRRILIEADLQTPPHLVLLLSGGGALAVFVAVYQAMGWIVPSLFAAAGVAALPIAYVWWRRETRLTEKEEALVVALERVYEELRTVTIQEALVSLGATAPPPVQPAFQRLAADLAQQRDYGDALRASKARLGCRAWDDCVAGLLLAHAVGERNIREVFKRIAGNARAQVQLRRRVHSQQAEQITGARITLVVPIAVVVFMRVSFPDADRFYTTPGGELLLFVCGIAMLVGYWSMLKIGRVARPSRANEEQRA